MTGVESLTLMQTALGPIMTLLPIFIVVGFIVVLISDGFSSRRMTNRIVMFSVPLFVMYFMLGGFTNTTMQNNTTTSATTNTPHATPIQETTTIQEPYKPTGGGIVGIIIVIILAFLTVWIAGIVWYLKHRKVNNSNRRRST
jgi:hypothetical protein